MSAFWAPRPGYGRSMSGRMLGTLSAAVVVAVLSGCSSNRVATERPTGATDSAPQSPAASTSPEPARATVLTQYTAFWRSLTPASKAEPGARRAILSKVAADPELSSLLSGIARERSRGRAFYGVDVPRARVTQLLSAQGIAVIDDCQDSSGSGVMELDSGRRLTKGVAHNHVVSTMHRGGDGIWRVASVEYPKSSC